MAQLENIGQFFQVRRSQSVIFSILDHPKILFLFGLLSPLWCFSILVNYYFEAFFNLNAISLVWLSSIINFDCVRLKFVRLDTRELARRETSENLLEQKQAMRGKLTGFKIHIFIILIHFCITIFGLGSNIVRFVTHDSNTIYLCHLYSHWSLCFMVM